MNKRYFRLNPYAVYKIGEKDGCIYNLSNGQMFRISIQNAETLKKAEGTTEINELNNDERKFLDLLNKNGLGRYYESPVYIEKIYLGESTVLEKNAMKNVSLQKLYLEVSNECNLNCIFCNPDDWKSYKRTGCKRWKADNCIDIDKYKDVIERALKLGLDEIIFTGGEPFLEFEKVGKLVKFAYNLGIRKFSAYTNTIMLSEEMIEFIKKFNMNLIVQVVALKENQFKLITQTDLKVDIIEKMRKLINNNINIIVKVLVNKLNEDSIEDIISQLEACGLKKRIFLDYIYPHNKEYCSSKYSNKVYDKNSKLTRSDLASYSLNRKYNKCFYNQVAITSEGDVIPCVMLRSVKLGSILEKNLYEILEEDKYYDMITLNKTRINRCKDCSLSFGCNECMSIQYEVTGNLNEMEYCK